MKTKRTAIYLRVSTTDQSTDNQEHELRREGLPAQKAFGYAIAAIQKRKKQGIFSWLNQAKKVFKWGLESSKPFTKFLAAGR
jgi:predicted site-specific integrase-resolvase